MCKKILLVFIGVLASSFFLLQFFFKTLRTKQETIDAQKTAIIQENIKDRFSLLLHLPLSIGLASADYFFNSNHLDKNYGRNTDEILKLNDEILGLNILDAKGEIVKVYPVEDNSKAIGRRTQNFENMKLSFKRGEKYWLSPPFKLFQNKIGFVLYIPITDGKILKGWAAPVISSQLFFETFKLPEYLKSYELIVQDEKSGMNYFETSMHRSPESKIYKSKMKLMGRDLRFISWTKNGPSPYKFPWYWIVLVSLLLAILASMMTKLLEARKTTQQQLRDISVLLSLTSKEALNTLVDMHAENRKPESNKNISYVKNLIEQIDLLQTMARVHQSTSEEVINFYSITQSQSSQLNDIIQKKNLTLEFTEENLQGMTFRANKWLFENSVISNILSHSIIFAKPGTSISIVNKPVNEKSILTFHTQEMNTDLPLEEAIVIDRRLEVSKRLIQYYQGEMFVQKDLSHGMIIRIVLPLLS